MNTLIVFGRSPGATSGKTRLRAHLRGDELEGLYPAFFADVLSWPLPAHTSIMLAVTESPDGFAALAPATARIHIQPERDFGARLADAIDTAFAGGAERVVLVGTDAPTLPAAVVAACFDGLERHPATIVPASDGGWVALGVDRPIGDAFDGIPWSTNRTCRATERALVRSGRRPRVLRPWYDVDDARGLDRIRGELRDAQAAARAPRTASVLRPDRRADPRWLSWLDHRGPALIGAASALLGLAVSLVRFYSYHLPAYDLGFYDQVAWNTVHGHLFLSTFLGYSFLGEHWEPALGLFAQLYRIVASPVWLMLVQAAALGLAPIAAARLARIWLPGVRHAPVIVALALACSPLLTNAAPLGYHTEALTPAVALFALEAAATRQRLRFVLLLLVLGTLKEDALLVAAGTGWVAWRVERERLGLAAAVAGVLAFLVVVLLAMPFFRGGQPSDLAASYAWLDPGSTSLGAYLRAALTHPGLVVGHLLAPTALRGWALALLPLALLPLLSGWALPGALVPLLVSLLSSDVYQGSLQAAHGLESAPLLVACALLGWRRLPPLPQVARTAGLALAGASVASYFVAAALPGGRNFFPQDAGGLERFRAVNAVLDRVASNAPVAASPGLVTHLSERQEIWEFPAGLGVRYIVLDSRGPLTEQSRAAGYQQALSRMPGWHYRVVAGADGVTLWELP